MLIQAAALMVLAAAPFAAAQEDVVADDTEPIEARGMLHVNINPAIANLEHQVDQLLFGRFGGAGVARNKLDSALALRIDEVDRASGVKEDQKKKLELAGRGDIKRFFDRVEEVKRRSANQPNAQFNNVWQEIQPLQAELSAGLFGDDSLFSKTVRRTLTGEQQAAYEAALSRRKRARYEAAAGWFTVELDRSLGMSHGQRAQLAELLVKETRPPKRFGQQDYWFMMMQTAKLPESQLKQIFDDVQWRLLARQLVQAKGMLPFLQMRGVVLDDNPAAVPEGVIAVVPLVPANRNEQAAPRGQTVVKPKE